ncbi:YxiG-like protein [Streptomyces canus]
MDAAVREQIVCMTAAPGSGVEPSYLRYFFRRCVEAGCEPSVPAETWQRSMDDRLIDDPPDKS